MNRAGSDSAGARRRPRRTTAPGARTCSLLAGSRSAGTNTTARRPSDAAAAAVAPARFPVEAQASGSKPNVTALAAATARGRRRHRQELEIAPDPGAAGLDPGPTDLGPHRRSIEDHLERPEALRTDEAGAGGVGAVRVATLEAEDPRAP